MKTTRRAAVSGALLGFTGLASLMARPLAAADKKTRLNLSVLYPNKPDAKFDFDYYRDKHLALFRELYGAAVGPMTVRKGLRAGDGSPAPFVAILSVIIENQEAFDAAGKLHFQKLFDDLPNFSNIVPVGQVDEIL
jgi:uncharacterized protein (TIGR02118 family)